MEVTGTAWLGLFALIEIYVNSRLVATSCGFECYHLDAGNYGDHACDL